MGSSTTVIIISEAVATNCLAGIFFAKRFAKQMKERMSEATMTPTQCHHSSANPPFANQRANFKNFAQSKI